MKEMGLGKILVIVGIFMITAGLLLMLSGKMNGWPKLPGDILIKRDNFTLYFPITTMIIVSIVLTLIFYLINKFR